jgi:hypothetical protein
LFGHLAGGDRPGTDLGGELAGRAELDLGHAEAGWPDTVSGGNPSCRTDFLETTHEVRRRRDQLRWWRTGPTSGWAWDQCRLNQRVPDQWCECMQIEAGLLVLQKL